MHRLLLASPHSIAFNSVMESVLHISIVAPEPFMIAHIVRLAAQFMIIARFSLLFISKLFGVARNQPESWTNSQMNCSNLRDNLQVFKSIPKITHFCFPNRIPVTMLHIFGTAQQQVKTRQVFC